MLSNENKEALEVGPAWGKEVEKVTAIIKVDAKMQIKNSVEGTSVPTLSWGKGPNNLQDLMLDIWGVTD